jgi:hypothetical protein
MQVIIIGIDTGYPKSALVVLDENWGRPCVVEYSENPTIRDSLCFHVLSGAKGLTPIVTIERGANYGDRPMSDAFILAMVWAGQFRQAAITSGAQCLESHLVTYREWWSAIVGQDVSRCPRGQHNATLKRVLTQRLGKTVVQSLLTNQHKRDAAGLALYVRDLQVTRWLARGVTDE